MHRHKDRQHRSHLQGAYVTHQIQIDASRCNRGGMVDLIVTISKLGDIRLRSLQAQWAGTEGSQENPAVIEQPLLRD